ncbi:MAG: SPFH domain-containing protein [Bacilli bacterium]|nr:SPFH domain-containing protein [Bacilli bacterium]
MGLIKTAIEAVSTTVGDEFKEFVTCPKMERDVLIQRGIVNHGAGNKHYSENLITAGSTIAVPQGTAMMIVSNGEIKEFTCEPGEYKWDSSTEPSIFTGSLGKGIIDSFKTIGKRFTYGGQTATDQRVYFVNTLAITGNKFGSPQPKKITDDKYGMLEVTFFGEYAFQVTDPITLVHTVIGSNPKDTVTYDDVLGSQLKGKFVEQITKAITIVMRKHRIPFGDIGMYGTDISDEMNTILDDTWRKLYGLEITDVSLMDINLTDESMKRVSRIDDATIFSNANLQSGLIAQASAEALTTAAGNSNGAMMGFMGMNMAQQSAVSMMGAVNQNVAAQQQAGVVTPEPGTLFNNQASENVGNLGEQVTPQGSSSVCPTCNNPVSTEKFCPNCGTKLQ